MNRSGLPDDWIWGWVCCVGSGISRGSKKGLLKSKLCDCDDEGQVDDPGDHRSLASRPSKERLVGNSGLDEDLLVEAPLCNRVERGLGMYVISTSSGREDEVALSVSSKSMGNIMSPGLCGDQGGEGEPLYPELEYGPGRLRLSYGCCPRS